MCIKSSNPIFRTVSLQVQCFHQYWKNCHMQIASSLDYKLPQSPTGRWSFTWKPIISFDDCRELTFIWKKNVFQFGRCTDNMLQIIWDRYRFSCFRRAFVVYEYIAVPIIFQSPGGNMIELDLVSRYSGLTNTLANKVMEEIQGWTEVEGLYQLFF